MEQKQTPLAAIWSQITALLEAGYSLIPVRDKAEGDRPAKSPYIGWKKYQTEKITAAELWTQMAERFNTNAVAVVCGAISQNFEAIDIDVKWKPGIDARLFGDIKMLYPELWQKLRLHRSPSGGYHIPYKIIDQPPAVNKKLARRAALPGETKGDKAFIETRGEGGIILLPPSMGYSVFKAEPVPLLTWTERCSLIGLCESYNEVIKIETQKKPTKREDDYYDENPFEHFNKSEAGRQVLTEFGWTPNGESNEFAWFTRPGSKSGERHGSFIKKKGLFFFWSTNTEFDSEKCYYPATVLATLRFSGDYKLTFKELVNRGFGRIKASKEARLVLTAKEAPPNLSIEAKQEFDRRVRERSEAHPHGIFWEISPEERGTIDREALYNVSGALGFMLYQGEIVRLVPPGFLQKVDERTYYDTVKAYIHEEDADLYQLIINTYEHFLQVAGTFTQTRLPLLDETKILNDTATTCYKFFQDKWIRITADEVEEFSYDALVGYVWQTKVFDRPFTMQPGGKYLDFLERAVEFTKLEQHVLKLIGYLAHEYKDETTAYIIVLTEQCPDPKQGGGSGKNLFCNLFKNITTVATRPGEQIKYDEKFFQTWNGEKLFVLSDAPKDFNFLFLKELTSGSAVLKKLWKDEREITVEYLPKIIVNTNYSYEITDGGLKRRIIPLEFTDFFTRNKGVRTYYKAHFSRDWDAIDWAGYNALMVQGIQAWLQNNLILEPPALTVGGWRKQFEQTYGHYTADFIYEHFSTWQADTFVSNTDFKKQLGDYFEERGIAKMYQPSTHRINKAIEDYCQRLNIKYEQDVQKKVNGFNVKCKIFGTVTTIEEEDLPF